MKFKKKGEKTGISKKYRKKLEFVDFSLIGPVSTQFTNYFAIYLKNSSVQRKRRIKILKTIYTRYCNDLGHMILRFPIYHTGPVKIFFEKKTLVNFLLSIILLDELDSFYYCW